MVHEAINGHGHEVTVKVTSASTVAPALPVQEHRLPLSNLDLILPPMDVGVFFCYGAGEGSDGGGALLPAATLKAALAKVLVAYYPLAGEVVANTRGEGELLCSGRGVDFAEATAGDAVLRQLRLAVVDESAEKLVPKKKAGVMCVQVSVTFFLDFAIFVTTEFCTPIFLKLFLEFCTPIFFKLFLEFFINIRILVCTTYS